MVGSPDNPFLIYCLGCEQFTAADYHGACTSFQRAMELLPKGEGYLSDLVIKAGLCLYKLGRRAEMQKLIGEYQQLFPLSKELHFLSGLAHLRELDYTRWGACTLIPAGAIRAGVKYQQRL